MSDRQTISRRDAIRSVAGVWGSELALLGVPPAAATWSPIGWLTPEREHSAASAEVSVAAAFPPAMTVEASAPVPSALPPSPEPVAEVEPEAPAGAPKPVVAPALRPQRDPGLRDVQDMQRLADLADLEFTDRSMDGRGPAMTRLAGITKHLGQQPQ